MFWDSTNQRFFLKFGFQLNDLEFSINLNYRFLFAFLIKPNVLMEQKEI